MTSFYSQDELAELGFAHIGEKVYISRKASIYGANNISIGNNVRIDDFVILSGKIEIGDNVHIAAASLLYGGSKGIEICDFANISSRVAMYAVSDDYSGESLTNPMVPDKYKNVVEEKVVIERHVIIATGSTVLPGVRLGEGCAIGAMSLVKADVKPWVIAAGIPVKYIKDRSKKLLELEELFLDENK